MLLIVRDATKIITRHVISDFFQVLESVLNRNHTDGS